MVHITVSDLSNIAGEVLDFIKINKIEKYSDIAHVINLNRESRSKFFPARIYTDKAVSLPTGSLNAYLIRYSIGGYKPVDIHISVGFKSTKIYLICEKLLESYNPFFTGDQYRNVIQEKIIESSNMKDVKLELENIIKLKTE